MDYRDVLVSLEHRDGTAVVVIDHDGDVWLSGDNGCGGTGLEDHRPAIEGLTGGRLLQGGRLPPGAVSATVIDAAGAEHVAASGGGAWLAVLTGDGIRGPLPVRFNRPGGELVAPPLPAEWPRARVHDATEDCPACGGRTWDVVFVVHGSRGGSIGPDGELTADIVVCTRCGHEERVGMFFGGEEIADDEDPRLVAARVRAAADRHHRSQVGALRRVSFPIYGVRGCEGTLGGWGSSGSSGGPTTSITILYGDHREPVWISVRTEREEDVFEDDAAAAARRALEESLDGGREWPSLSDPALALWLAARERERRRVTAGAAVEQRMLTVGARPTPFTVVAAGDRWAAVGTPGPRLTVSACGTSFGQVELVVLDDPAALVSRRPRV